MTAYRLVAAVASACLLCAPTSPGLTWQSSSVHFVESSGDTENPDRGMFKQVQFDEGLNAANLPLGTKNIRVYFKIKSFTAKPLNQEYLSRLEAVLAAIERAGRRAIIRFVYDYPDSHVKVADFVGRTAQTAPIPLMTTHITQLAPVLRRHVHALSAIESGMIGFYGEQWGDGSTKQSFESVSNLLEAWQAAFVGLDVQILVRHTKHLTYYENKYGSRSSSNPRLGLWNDCLGAYDDSNMTKSMRTISEGETCSLPPKLDYSCATMSSYFQRAALGQLHADYYQPIISRLSAQGCLEDIKRKLGYRYVIRRMFLSSDHSRVRLEIENVGWGRSLRSRPLFLVSDQGYQQRISDLADVAPGTTAVIEAKIDNLLVPETKQLFLRTYDNVRFSNTTGNLVYLLGR